MIFSPTAKHALRALIYLAKMEGDGPVLGRIIAEAEDIPPQFLSKILHDLRVKGLVSTTKGPGGGYELARSSEEIRLLDVAEAIDGPIQFNNLCILGLEECSDEAPCSLHFAWKEFCDEFDSSINTLTLAEAAGTLLTKRQRIGMKIDKGGNTPTGETG